MDFSFLSSFFWLKGQRKILKHVWMLKTKFVGDKHCTGYFFKEIGNTQIQILQLVGEHKFNTNNL